MPQQLLSDFVSAMEAAGMLVRVAEEKRVDELPRVMEDHPTTAVLVEKGTCKSRCDASSPAAPTSQSGLHRILAALAGL